MEGMADVLAHAQHAVNLGDAQPVEDVRHQRLEAHVLHARHVLGTFEVVGGAVFATLASVIYDCSGCVSRRVLA